MPENLSKYLHLVNKKFKCSQPHNTSLKFHRIDSVNFILEKLIQLTKKLTQTIKNNKMHAIKVKRLFAPATLELLMNHNHFLTFWVQNNNTSLAFSIDFKQSSITKLRNEIHLNLRAGTESLVTGK